MRTDSANPVFSTAELKQKSIFGAMWTFGAQGGKLLLQMLSVVLLARLLAPEDYGLFGMAAVFTQMVFIVKDLGLSQAAVQKKTLLPEESSALFWINVLFVTVLAAVCCVCAPLVAAFYDEPRLAAVVAVSSAANLIVGLSAQHKAILQRQLRMKELAFVEVLSKAISLVSGVAGALCGLRYWALVLATIADAAAHTLLLWFFCRWKPALVSLSHGRECLKFGLDVAAFNLMNFFSRNIDKILVGKFHPVEVVGYYNKAYQAVSFPIQHLRGPILQVANPALARLQDDPEKFRNYYRRLLSVLAFVSVAPVALFIPLAEEFVLVLLGRQWIPASGTFALLAVSALIQPVASTRGSVLVAAGKSRAYFAWGVVNTVCTVSAFAIAAPRGIEAMALGYAVVNYGLLLPSWIFCARGTPVRWMDFFSTVWRALAGGGVVIAAGFLCADVLCADCGPVARLCATVPFAMASWLLYWLAVPGGRAMLKTLRGDLDEAFRKFRRSGK